MQSRPDVRREGAQLRLGKRVSMSENGAFVVLSLYWLALWLIAMVLGFWFPLKWWLET
jgi:hypothetical protein